MKKVTLIRILAPIGVATGITVFLVTCNYACNYFKINDLFSLLSFVPDFVIYIVGAANLTTYLPFFIIGIIDLGQRNAAGVGNILITDGIYKYLRNPMYAGVSFSIIGLGLVLGVTGVLVAGLLWLLISYFQTLREEKRLVKEHGRDYLVYKSKTPKFVPDFPFVAKDIFQKLFLIR